MSHLDSLLESYHKGKLSRGAFVRSLLALGLGAPCIDALLGPGATRAVAAPVPQPVPSHAPYFVLIVMDAFRADYLDLSLMPNVASLIDRGVFFPHAWVGQLESYTPASHATISAGARPAHTGVIGFDWRDPQTGQETYTAWYNDVIAGKLEQQLQQYGVNNIPLAVKAHDPAARVVALSSEKYYAADAMGGPAADYIIYGYVGKGKIVPRGIPHHVPPQQYLKIPSLTQPWPLKWDELDDLAMTMALEALPSLDPRVLMINLPGPDVYGHRYGGPARMDVMTRIITGIDRQVGRLLVALRDRNILDQTVIVLTADHGMVPNIYQIDDKLLKRTIRKAGGDYLFHSGGNSAYIWLRNPEAAPKVAQYLVNHIDHAPFAYYQTLESGSYIHHAVSRTGTVIPPGLEAAYQYLLGTFAGSLAPDISLVFEENTITRWYPDTHGEHGGATAGAQAIPLVIAGPGVPSGKVSTFPARLMDVAPTVLTLLGIEPTNMDGIVLADALQTPLALQQRAQDDLQAQLTAYQQAIMARSAADEAAQRTPVAPLTPAPPGPIGHS